MYCATTNNYDIIADQGASLIRAFFLKNSAKKPINLTGYIGRMHIRESASSSVILQTLSTDSGNITIDPLLGRVDILIKPSETADLEAKTYVYDLELESESGEITKFMAGTLTIRAEITY